MQLPVEQLATIIAGCLSSIAAFILGVRRQRNTAQHQFNADNERFRKEVLSLVELEKKNNANLLKRVESLEDTIFELKSINQTQALQKIKDAEEISRLSLEVEKYNFELTKIKCTALEDAARSKKLIDELELKLELSLKRCFELENSLKAALQRCSDLEAQILKFKSS